MRIFISSDMEGTAGVVDWDQVRVGGPDYRTFAELTCLEVNAAIEGARSAGATSFLVNDSHGKMANFRPDALAGGARYLSGRLKPRYMMQGLCGSFDAAFFVAYHGSMSANGSVLSHTYFPAAIAEVTLNGRVVGESGINALVALAYEVPIVLVTGDEATASELTWLCPGIRTAVVKRSVTRFAADSMHPEEARACIREEAREAVLGLAAARPPAIDLPATLDIRFHTSDYALLAARIGGIERTGDLSARASGDDPLALFDAFVTAVLLCRGFVE